MENINEKTKTDLEKSLIVTGILKPLIVNKASQVLSGNLRVRSAIAIGLSKGSKVAFNKTYKKNKKLKPWKTKTKNR